MPKRRSQDPVSVASKNQVLNAEGAAVLLGVSSRLVLRLARAGTLPARKVGKEWRFTSSAILQWLGKVEAMPEWVEPLVRAGKAKVVPRREK
jgi:excisionase family DNA binding protein